MTCTCPVPPSYLPSASNPVFEARDGVVTHVLPPHGIGSYSGNQQIAPECPLHGVEAERARLYTARRDRLLAWRKIRQQWPKARRDAAAAIGVVWYEYADPNGDFYRWWPE